MKIYLLKNYKNHGASKIIEIKDDIALDLILLKIARKCITRDFLIKSEFNSNTKAFFGSPSLRKIRIKKT